MAGTKVYFRALLLAWLLKAKCGHWLDLKKKSITHQGAKDS